MPSYGTSVILTYVAWDTNANVGKSGDVANHTLRWIKDGTSSAPTNSPSEIDATNAPGAYKLTLTTGECTCQVGTLVGKSSTANVSIIPISVSFELLPTTYYGTAGGIPILDGSTNIPANLKAIDGLATNGNNATLKLKSFDLRSNDPSVAAFEMHGASGGAGLDGGKAFNIRGGAAGTGGANGGDAVYALGGGGTTTRGLAMFLDATSGGSGLKVVGEHSFAAIFAGYNGDDISGNIVGNVTGSVGSLDTQAKADVNAEVKDVIETDTQAEPVSVPSSTASLRDKIAWLFTLGKNKRTQTATTETVLADDGTTPIATSAKSDTGTTFTRGKFQ